MSNHRARLLRATVVSCACFAMIAYAQQAYRFTVPAGKQLPYNAKAPTTDLLATCDALGRMGQIPATPKKLTPSAQFEQLQAERKNDLWESAASPIAVTFDDFDNLQTKLHPSKTALSTNRTDLQSLTDIGGGRSVKEGTVVQLVARVADAHVSDCDKSKSPGGENVNCNTNTFDGNDIHVVLMPPGTSAAQDKANECDSVTAELIPHFRPETWRQFDAKAPQRLARFTGPMFYDASHRTCKEDPSTSPKRRALWEIHPTYRIEVCTQTDTKGDCQQWTAYDEWIGHVSAAEKFADVGLARRKACGSPSEQP